MNSRYSYDTIGLWDESAWKHRISPISGLIAWMGKNEKVDPKPYHSPVDGLVGDRCKTLGCYAPKTNSVNIPSVVEGWRAKGVHYECRSQGGIDWIIMAPVSCFSDFGAKLPTLVVMHREDTDDPYWAMKTLERFGAYNEMVAESGGLDRHLYRRRRSGC
jgi:hypothetical protein